MKVQRASSRATSLVVMRLPVRVPVLHRALLPTPFSQAAPSIRQWQVRVRPPGPPNVVHGVQTLTPTRIQVQVQVPVLVPWVVT
jgi:hypothetical protein